MSRQSFAVNNNGALTGTWPLAIASPLRAKRPARARIGVPGAHRDRGPARRHLCGGADPVKGRHGDFTAQRRWQTRTGVVDQHDNDVGRVVMQALRYRARLVRRLLQRASGDAARPHRRERQHATIRQRRCHNLIVQPLRQHGPFAGAVIARAHPSGSPHRRGPPTGQPLCTIGHPRVLTLLDRFLTLMDVYLVRGSSLTGFEPLVRTHGGDPHTFLRAAGIDPADVGDDDRFIPLRSAIAAVEYAATVMGVPAFGRQLGRRQSIDILGPVSVAARTAATVGVALDVLVTYMDLHSPGITTRITDHADPALRRFEYGFLLHPVPPQAQAIELALGLTLQVLRMFLGIVYRPVTVHLPHPPLGSVTDYHDYFGCPPHFAESVAGFTLRAKDLERPLTHDPLAHRLALSYLSETQGQRKSAIADTVGSVVRQLLSSGELSAALVARQFGIHPKTMQRRLAAEGTTFAELVDGTRRELALRLLTGTDLPVSQVSRQLGYAEHSVFTRACKRWFGVTPREYRNG